MNRRLTDMLLDQTVQGAKAAAIEASCQLRFATVTDVDDGTGTLTCELAGVILRDVPYLAGNPVNTGDAVWLIHQGPTVVALGSPRTASSGGVWDDLRTPLTRVTTGANAPTWATMRDNLNTYSFDAGTMNQVWFEVQLPHGWVAGSDLKPHIHWSPGASTNTGVVRWGLEYSWSNAVNPPGNVFPASTTIYVEQAASGTQYAHQIASFPTIAGTGKRLSSVLMCRLFRDAAHSNDTFTGAAFGVSVDVHHRVGSDGSVDEYPEI